MYLFCFLCGAVCVGISALVALGVAALIVRWVQYKPAQEILHGQEKQAARVQGEDKAQRESDLASQWANLFAYDGKPQKKDGDEI